MWVRAPLTVSLVQCDSVLGDVDRNLEAHLQAVEHARAARADIVVFPELSLCGYGLRDLTSDVSLKEGDPRLARLASASASIDIVVGYIEESSEHALYNVAAYFSNGTLKHVHRKVYPVNYGMFEERRYWAAGDKVAAFDTARARLGMLVCEDLWHPSTSYLLFADRADVIVTISASPARGISRRTAGETGSDAPAPGSTHTWDALLRHQSMAFNVWSVYVNRVGVEDGTSFSGNSRVLSPDGEAVVRLGLEEAQVHVVLEPGPLRRRRAESPMLRDERLDVTLGNLDRIARERFGH